MNAEAVLKLLNAILLALTSFEQINARLRAALERARSEGISDEELDKLREENERLAAAVIAALKN